MDPALVEALDALLPQTQCTRCSFAGCRPYAVALAEGSARPNQCPPGGEATAKALAAALGLPALPLDPAHGLESAPRVAVIDETVCIGCAKCLPACPVDAIVGARRQLHTVIAAECSGCDLCLPACPVDCITMVDAADAPLAPTLVSARADVYRRRFEAHQERTVRLAARRAARLAGHAPDRGTTP
jgi:electron transport complex protein RnfB